MSANPHVELIARLEVYATDWRNRAAEAAIVHEAIAALRDSPRYEVLETAVMVCPQCEGEGGYPDGLDEAACHTECTRCGSNGWIVDRAALQAADALEAATPSGQIEWTPGEPPKEAGMVVYGHTWQPYRWQPYKPTSEQFRRGVKGRWQAMNEYGGWDNAKAPDEWASEAYIAARTALEQGEGKS